ncbi:copper resistance D family protein [Paracidobacterium acidisoli]|uniref:Copper resistance protein n=1 Tax=Paracidobacterium acidisoli TaxID=2303751 RepID=A0A372IPE2_9BACT|nr:CopD family protein [Paracidobacterium acidisoli]MBT9331081.1 CopD family protein [Paracidobacterium acidisoli]
MIWLLRDFDLLSVILRAASLSLEALTLGGLIFLLLVAVPAGADRLIQTRIRRVAAWFALALVAVKAAGLAISSLELMSDSGMSFREVASAGYFIAGCAMAGAALVLFVLLRSRRRWVLAAASLAGLVLLCSSVALSHAASRMDSRVLLLVLTGLHHLGTAAWIGAMPYLLLGLRRSGADAEQAAKTMVRRFSTMAIVSVPVLVLAGVGMSWFYVGSWQGLYGTSYGAMLSAKIYLLLLALTLGGGNFLLVRRMERKPQPLLLQIRRFGELEIVLGFAAILAAASLTAQSPAADDMPQDKLTGHEIAQRMEWKWPSFRTPTVAQLVPPTPLSVAVPEVVFTGGVPNDANDRAWSEYNHHWAGLIVLAAGLFALLSRLPRQHWAAYWPLLFLGLSVFLILRADPECWPLGPRPFWASFTAPDVLEHRLYAALIAVFALFQCGVETGRLTWAKAKYFFPAMCMLGGALLLTHSHALGDMKAEMFAEMTHTPIALLGVTAGCGRWLELRLATAGLPGMGGEERRGRRIAAWVWPVCLMLIGLLLLDYRES